MRTSAQCGKILGQDSASSLNLEPTATEREPRRRRRDPLRGCPVEVKRATCTAAASAPKSGRIPSALGSLIGILLLLATGCSKGPEVVPVDGRITLAQGAWPAGGTIYFTPIEPAEGFPMRPGWGEFGLDGRFTATSYKPGDGLVPGRYHAALECWAAPPVMGSKAPPKSAIPAKYRSPVTSGLELDIKPGQRKATVGWDVTPERP